MNRRQPRFYKLVRRQRDGRHEAWPANAAPAEGYDETTAVGHQDQMQAEAARRNRRGCLRRLFFWW